MAITQTNRFGLTQWSSGDDAVGRAYFLSDNLAVESLGAIFQSGTSGSRPAASDDIAERSFWYSTDEGVLYFSNGSDWVSVNDLALSSDPYTIVAGTVSNSQGVSTRLARADHKHSIATASATTVTGSNTLGSSTSLARADHNHALGSGVVGTSQLAGTSVTRAKLNSDVVNLSGALTVSTSNGLSVNTGSTISISGNALIVTLNSINETHLNPTVAGNGLSGGNGTALTVNVDSSTIEINSDILRIKDGGVVETKIGVGAVTETRIGTGAVTATKIGADAVTREKINANVAGVGLGQAIGGELDVKYDNDTIGIDGSNRLYVKAGSIGTNEIVNSGVDTSELADDAVTAAKINPDVAGAGLAQDSNGALYVNTDDSTLERNLDTIRIKDDGVTAAKINADVAGGGLAQATGGSLYVNTDNVTLERTTTDTIRIKDLGVGSGKLADDSVTRDKINSNVAGSGLGQDSNGALYVKTTDTINKDGSGNLKVADNTIGSKEVDSTVYVRHNTDFSASSANIYIRTDAPSNTLGASGDIWFRY